MKILFIADLESGWRWMDELYNGVRSAAGDELDVIAFKINELPEPQFEGIDVVVDEGSFGGRTDLVEMAHAADVKLWQCLANGIDHVDVATFRRLKFPLANTSGALSGIALAEHAMFLMLSFAKKYAEHESTIRKRGICDPVCTELSKATLGILGLGASGRELATRAAAFGMRILGVEPMEIEKEILAELGIESVVKPEQMNDILPDVDYLSIHVPLAEETRHLIDRKALELMKPSSILINVARGSIVDEDALLEVLQAGGLCGAGLDVFANEPVDPEHPLLQLDNVLVTPHIAGVTTGTARRRGEAAVENINRLERGEPLRFLVAP